MKKIILLFVTSFLLYATQAQNVNVNPGAGSYATLQAAFTAINAGTHTGAVTVDIVGNTTETGSAILNASGAGAASYTSIIISPSGGASRTITGSVTGHLIDLNGADNVTIDGLNSGGNSLSISNTASGASSTIRYIGDATNNIVQKATLLGSTTSFGVVYFSTGTTTGNDGNNINNCVISAAGGNFPLNGIYSFGTGTVGIENSGITVNANEISDYFNAGSATSGMNINTGSTNWTITNNKLFQTATRLYTTANTHQGINITNGDGYTITGNIIGFANNTGSGTTNIVGNTVALTGTFPSSYTTVGTANATRYVAINCAFTAAGVVSSIQNNTIAGFALYTSSGASTTTGVFCGIAVTAGNANIGTTTGNTIGSTSGTGSIYTACTSTGGMAAGIYATTSNTISIQNNTIGAIDAMGTTSSISGAINGINAAGSGSMTVSGNTIGNTTNPNLRMGNLNTGANLSNTGTTFGIASGSGAFKGILAASSGTTKLIGTVALPNTIRNASLNSSSASATFRGIENSGSGVAIISSNAISNITSASTSVSVSSGGLAGLGIYLSAGTSCVVNANSITGLSLSSTGTGGYNIGGISYTFPTTSISVTNNKICDLSNASTSVTTTAPGTASGIFIRDGGGSINNISNNMIALGNGQTTNTTFMGVWAQYGLSTATTLKIYHNTIDIEGTAGSGAQPSFGINRGDFSATAATTYTMDIKNNILINNRTGGTGKHYAIANNYGATASATGWGANASNYNVLNGTAANIGYWTTDKTFAAWQTASAGDGNSLTAIPVTFVSACDLHLNMGVTPTQLESGGTSGLGISTDIDGQARPGPAGSVNGGGTAPDLGADEFDGVLLDLVGPTIVYTPLGNAAVGSNQTLTATITDASGVPTSGPGLPVLYYKINGGAYTAVTGTSIGSNQYTFTFGSATTAVGDVVSYYIVAQDGAATPNVGSSPSAGAGGFSANPPAAATPPTTPSTFTAAASISGILNVGSGQTYTSLTNTGVAGVFAAINASVVTGNITVNILSDLTAETGAVALNAFASPYTVTINPSGVARVVSGALASAALVKLNGADRVTIDGSIGGTGTDRSLTITNTSTTSPTAIALISLGTGAGAISNTIKNTNISTGVSAATGYGISVGGSTPGTAGADNDATTIQNNNITIATIPIYANGTAAVSTGGLDNLNIIGNTVNTNTTIANIGIQAGNALTSLISQNTVSVETSTFTQPVGISLETGFVSSTVSRNNIIKSLTTSTGGYGGRGITAGTGTATSALTISNNMVSGVNGSNFSGFSNSSSFGIGIGVSGAGVLTTTTGGVNLYYNSVNMAGNSTYAAADLTAALYVGSGASALDVRNNIFVNSIGNSSATTGSKSYCVYSLAPVSAFTTINYNDYYPVTQANATGLVGFLTSDRATLANWQAATLQDANSVSGDPKFTSTSDLHISTTQATIIESAGTPIGGTTTDFDGDARNGTTPDIGADEGTFIAVVANDMQATAFISPTNGGAVPAGSAFSPQASFTNNGTATQTNVTVRYRIVDAGSLDVYNNTQVIASIANGVTTTVTFPSTTLVAGNYTIFAKAELAGDLVPANDQISGTLSVLNPLCGTISVGASQPVPYNTLTGAIGRLNSLGVSCAVTLSLTDASYPAETFPITINSIAGASATNKITIKPTQAATTMSGSSASALIVMNGADFITLDGSISATANTVCPAAAATRDLTLTNTNTGTSSAVVWMQTTAGADAATNNTVMNLNLIGSGNTQTLFGVGGGGNTISLSSLGTNNNNNSIINNNISATQYGIYSQGASAANKNTGTVINQNLINTVSPNNVAKGGIVVGFADNVTISGNNISGIVQTSSPDVFGITLGVQGISTSTFTGNEVTNATVTNNIVGSIRNTGTFSACGICVAPATSGTNLIANNMISGVSANGTSGDFSVGMLIGGGTGSTTRIYYNTITMTSVPANTGASDKSYALAIGGTDPIVDIRNNILVNTQNNGTGNNYAIGYGYGTFVNLTSSNNDYFVTNPGATFFIGATGSISAPTNQATVANLQTATGKDGNAQNLLPSFVSATDLHLNNNGTNAPLFSAGTAVSVTTDIDCANRGGNPDIGADQVSIAVVAVGVEYFRGSKQGPANFLDWKVNCSSDPSVRLILERSADSRTFTAIQDQNVTAARCAQGFSFTDASPLAGINYYRLKTISPDGAFRYSAIVALINKDKGFELISVAPNPVKTNTVLSISTVKAGKMSITVSDMTGKVVMTQTINVIAGNNPIPMNFATLGAGTYNIKVINSENEVKTTRFVKY